MYTKYLFFGGPWHLKTEPANGQYYFYVVESPELKFTTEVAEEVASYAPTFKQHVYNLRKINMFGSLKSVYVHIDYPIEQANQMIGELMSGLFDLYVEA